MKISKEKRGHHNYFVVREKGRILSAVKVKGSRLTLRSAGEIYKSRGTFSKDYTQRRMSIGKTIEVTRFYGDKIPNKLNQMKKYLSFQYVIGTRDIGGRDGIWGRSDKISELDYNSKTAQNQAEHRFYANVDKHETGGYDEDDGREFVHENNINVIRGYVWYIKPRRKENVSVRRNRR